MHRSWLEYGMIACLVSVASSTSTGGDVAATQQYSQGETGEGNTFRLGRDTMVATIVDMALENDDFSTLVAALTAAGLVDVIAGEGPFTVFGTCCCFLHVLAFIVNPYLTRHDV